MSDGTEGSNRTSRQAKLPDEIIEAQKNRSEFLKWKLALVSALGAAGLGLMKESTAGHVALLALIPFVCVYVDLLCSNINLRIILIGRHYESQGDSYEEFVALRRIAFSLEDWALFGSTYFISILLVLFGASRLLVGLYGGATLAEFLPSLCLLPASIVGIVLTRWVKKAYCILSRLEEVASDRDTTLTFYNNLRQEDNLFRYLSQLFPMRVDVASKKTG